MSDMMTPATLPRMEPEAVEAMLTHILRLPDMFTKAMELITPEFFSTATEPHFLALWITVGKIHETYGMESLFSDPTSAWKMLELELLAYCRANPMAMSDGYQDRLLNPENGFLAYTYSVKLESLGPSYAKNMFRQFVNERYVQDALRNMVMMAGDRTVTNLPLFLQQMQERRLQVESMDDNPVQLACPDDWEPKPLGKFSTGLAFMDRFLNGGHAAGETYGILGAFGAGKTTMAVQLVTSGAVYQSAKMLAAQARGEVYHPKKWYFFHYEGSSDEMRVRLMSVLCEIDKDLLEEWRLKDMSTIGKLKAYEQIRYADHLKNNEEVDGEKERWEKRRHRINGCFGMIDMSGAPENPKRGEGYIPEIAMIVGRDVKEESHKLGRPLEVGGIVIDYAGLCVRRHLNAKTRTQPDDFYRYLTNFGDDSRRMLAVAFHCPVWVMHQLSGQANKKTTAAKQGHADAAGSASFAENLHFCFALGTKDSEYGSTLLTCSKQRRADIGPSPRLEFDKPIAQLRESDLISNSAGQLRRSSESKTTM